MKIRFTLIMMFAALLALQASVARAEEEEHEHFDITPYLISGQLVTGGLDHEGHHTPPTVTVYGLEFGEEPLDPFNPSDPGVNQASGTGNLPPGGALSYNILSSLLYWDGSGGDVSWGSPGDAYITLLMGTNFRTITGSSSPQAGSLIQSVLGDGSVHKHFTTSLFAAPGTENVPGAPGYQEPDAGIYAFSLELTLNASSVLYTSNPFWVVFNNGLDEEFHEQAMNSLVPEPSSLLLMLGMGAMIRRRR